jgi:muconolactone delta-isomerase
MAIPYIQGVFMKFLIVSVTKHVVPPEAIVPIMDAMQGWIDKYKTQFEQVWSFAGVSGGGGMLNVSSLEGLDQIMTEFPSGSFSDTQVCGLLELPESRERYKQAFAPMMGASRPWWIVLADWNRSR